jgi:hypothetical protein
VTESEQLQQARTAALGLIQGDAQLGELRGAASDLGAALVATADDERLWNGLAEGRGRLNTLTDEQRLALRTAVSVDWPAILDRVGYQPPPPPEVYGTEFVEAIEAALKRHEPATVDIVREKLRVLGQTLVELSGQEHLSPSRLRRWLRRGVRVAGKVLVVLAVTVAGVALVHTLPALGPASLFLPEVALDLLKDGTVRVLEWTLDRALPADESDDDQASDRGAVEQLYGIRNSEIGSLTAAWAAAAAAFEENPTDAAQFSALQPLEETSLFVERAIRAVYRAWDAAIGAPWYTGDLAERFDVLSMALQGLRTELSQYEPNAKAITAITETLRHVQAVLSGVKSLPRRGDCSPEACPSRTWPIASNGADRACGLFTRAVCERP